MSELPHLFTLTGNLLCERTLNYADWSIGRSQRAAGESFQVGGKGINVAKMLQRLGAPTTALCFTGGATGLECEEWLRVQPFAHHTFQSDQATRVGIVIRGGNHPETTFMGRDRAPGEAAIRACAEFLDTQPAGQVLAVCGSIPGWIGPEFDPLRAALGRWMQRGTLVGDSYGPPLAWLAAQPLALIKINAVELRALFPSEPPTIPIARLLETAARQSPVRRWVVSDGGGPIWYRDEAGTPALLTPPKISEVSPTGSGDVMLACVLEAFFRQKRALAESIRYALPYAAANAAHPGIAEFDLPLQE